MKGAITTDPAAIKKIVKTHYEQLYAHKFDSRRKGPINSLKTQPR